MHVRDPIFPTVSIVSVRFFSYVWDNLGTGYIQGMCDLVAPLLVVFDEGKTVTDVVGGGDERHCLIASRGDRLQLFLLFDETSSTEFPPWRWHGRTSRSYAFVITNSRRWTLWAHSSYRRLHPFLFLLPLDSSGFQTRFVEFNSGWTPADVSLSIHLEFVYDDIFLVWETIAAARRTVSKRFVLFIALAMLKSYRDIILDNRMDFTDIIRFFNGKWRGVFFWKRTKHFWLLISEMAERHDARDILRVARELVLELQHLIDNK